MRSPKKPEGGQGSLDFGRGAPPLELFERPDDDAGAGGDEPEPPPRIAMRQEAAHPADAQHPRVYSVAEIVRHASRTLETRFGLVWIEGEVSNLSSPRSGHLYFTLKDETASIQAAMFRTQALRLRFNVTDGLKVRAEGRLSIYESQGKFQLYVERLEPAGLGAAQLAFEQLKRRLEAEGLFAAERKRPLPPWPRVVGVVTSPTGAVVRDILRVAHRRGRVRFLISPCQVQGETAAREIALALRRVARHPEVDVVILARGGGSSEDLSAFNDENLARIIAACPKPVVSAVGHEVDFTIADFVADVRAPTPSAAAELVVPLFDDARTQLDGFTRRLWRAGQRTLLEARQRLDGEVARGRAAIERTILRRRRLLDELRPRIERQHPRARLARDRAALVELRGRLEARLRQAILTRRRHLGEETSLLASKAHPRLRLQGDRATLEALRLRVDAALRATLSRDGHELAALAGRLDALSPLGVLARGYALVRKESGEVVSNAAAVRKDEVLDVRLARGSLKCRVQSSALADLTEDDG